MTGGGATRASSRYCDKAVSGGSVQHARRRRVTIRASMKAWRRAGARVDQRFARKRYGSDDARIVSRVRVERAKLARTEIQYLGLHECRARARFCFQCSTSSITNSRLAQSPRRQFAAGSHHAFVRATALPRRPRFDSAWPGIRGQAFLGSATSSCCCSDWGGARRHVSCATRAPIGTGTSKRPWPTRVRWWAMFG